MIFFASVVFEDSAERYDEQDRLVHLLTRLGLIVKLRSEKKIQ